MTIKFRRVPAYCLHRASGKAIVRLDGKDHYLGAYGSLDSHSRYAELIAQWQRRKTVDSVVETSLSISTLTISDLILRYAKFAREYYSKDGRPTHEFGDMQYSLRPLRQLYGRLKVQEFGPLKLKDLQQHMVQLDWSRKLINARVNRIKRFFKWAVSEELAPPSILESLRSVSGLRYGRTPAREAPPIKPVADEHIEATLSYLSEPVRAMVRIQRLTGMRPCEVVKMRGSEVDRTGSVWFYEPLEHKNLWRDHRRQIPLGPQAQRILTPFLERPADQFLFSPREAEDARNQERRNRRKSPMTPSQRSRQRMTKPSRAARDCYDVDSYRQSIQYAVKRANRQLQKLHEGVALIPNWFPLQLRHSRATEIRRTHGIEAAQVSLGHARADVTQVYAERNLHLAIDVALQTG